MKGNHMEYAEYKKILDKGMIDYVNSGGSTFYMGSATKEYVFSYDNEQDAADHKKHLSDKAVQAILKKETLPKGIRLEKCIWHRKDCKDESY